MNRSGIDTKVLNEQQLQAFMTLDRYLMFPEIVQEYTDGSFRIRYGLEQIVYGTLMLDGTMIDINTHTPRASRKDS